MTKNWSVARVLRDRDAALYLAASSVSGFGTSALWLASGVWVKDLTGSNGLAALSVLALWVPTLLGPPLGTLADLLPRKPLLVALNLGPAALLLTVLAVDSGRGCGCCGRCCSCTAPPRWSPTRRSPRSSPPPSRPSCWATSTGCA